MDTKEDDGLIERELAPVGEDFKVLNIANYQITVTTGDRRGAGTDANVSITNTHGSGFTLSVKE